MKNPYNEWVVMRGLYAIIFLLATMVIGFQLGRWYEVKTAQPQVCSFAQCTRYIWQCEKVNYNGYEKARSCSRVRCER